jgi:hypothetical protein
MRNYIILIILIAIMIAIGCIGARIGTSCIGARIGTNRFSNNQKNTIISSFLISVSDFSPLFEIDNADLSIFLELKKYPFLFYRYVIIFLLIILVFFLFKKLYYNKEKENLLFYYQQPHYKRKNIWKKNRYFVKQGDSLINVNYLNTNIIHAEGPDLPDPNNNNLLKRMINDLKQNTSNFIESHKVEIVIVGFSIFIIIGLVGGIYIFKYFMADNSSSPENMAKFIKYIFSLEYKNISSEFLIHKQINISKHVSNNFISNKNSFFFENYNKFNLKKYLKNRENVIFNYYNNYFYTNELDKFILFDLNFLSKSFIELNSLDNQFLTFIDNNCENDSGVKKSLKQIRKDNNLLFKLINDSLINKNVLDIDIYLKKETKFNEKEFFTYYYQTSYIDFYIKNIMIFSSNELSQTNVLKLNFTDFVNKVEQRNLKLLDLYLAESKLDFDKLINDKFSLFSDQEFKNYLIKEKTILNNDFNNHFFEIKNKIDINKKRMSEICSDLKYQIYNTFFLIENKKKFDLNTKQIYFNVLSFLPKKFPEFQQLNINKQKSLTVFLSSVDDKFLSSVDDKKKVLDNFISEIKYFYSEDGILLNEKDFIKKRYERRLLEHLTKIKLISEKLNIFHFLLNLDIHDLNEEIKNNDEKKCTQFLKTISLIQNDFTFKYLYKNTRILIFSNDEFFKGDLFLPNKQFLKKNQVKLELMSKNFYNEFYENYNKIMINNASFDFVNKEDKKLVTLLPINEKTDFDGVLIDFGKQLQKQQIKFEKFSSLFNDEFYKKYLSLNKNNQKINKELRVIKNSEKYFYLVDLKKNKKFSNFEKIFIVNDLRIGTIDFIISDIILNSEIKIYDKLRYLDDIIRFNKNFSHVVNFDLYDLVTKDCQALNEKDISANKNILSHLLEDLDSSLEKLPSYIDVKDSDIKELKKSYLSCVRLLNSVDHNKILEYKEFISEIKYFYSEDGILLNEEDFIKKICERRLLEHLIKIKLISEKLNIFHFLLNFE